MTSWAVPWSARPHNVRELREWLRRSWEREGVAVPKGFWRWPRARLWAAWYEIHRRQARVREREGKR